MSQVRTIEIDQSQWEKRNWGVDHLPAIQSENMEMHFKKVFPNSIGVAHIHECDTLYYVLKGTIISISGDQLQHISIQKEGSFVHVPKNLLHTVANITGEEAQTVVSHNALNVNEITKCFPEYNEKLQVIFAECRRV
jgi:uncharacterized RmlC-like cupin family protein